MYSSPILLWRALAGVGAELAAGAAPRGPHEGDRADPVAGGRLLASLLLRRSSWWFPVAAGLVLAIVAVVVPRRRRRRRAVPAMPGRRAPRPAAVGRRDRHPDQSFDVAQESGFLGIAKRDRNPVGAGAGGAADAVHVAFRNVRQVVIDDVADAFDVDAARGDVGRDQRAQPSAAEGCEHALALAL